MISIISDIIELRLYVVSNGWYVMYDTILEKTSHFEKLTSAPMLHRECD